jgi:hypothetical protein
VSPLSYELDLIVLALLLYLIDSSPLLYSNEMVLEYDIRGAWSAVPGRIALARRLLCVLNPLTPHRPSFRLHWNLSGLERARENPTWSDLAKDLRVLRPAVLTAGIGLFIVLPVGMFSSLGSYAVVPALVLVYGATVAALFRLYGLRERFALSRGRFAAIAFECLACPPFAVNLVRKITLAFTVKEPLPLAAERLLSDGRWASVKAHCLSMLNDAIEVADTPGERQRLEAQTEHLAKLDGRR